MHPKKASIEATLQDVFDTPVVESVHLANQIFTLITTAEAGDRRARNKSVRELIRLKELYAESVPIDYKSLSLIKNAMELLAIDGDQ
ncbi:hypothetical protein D3C77_690610 [compost metagenome]